MNDNVDTIIGLHVILKGNLKNKGSIQVNGTIEGEVRSDEFVFVGETAKIKGPVFAKIVEVSGEVNGLIEATEKLEIHPTGRVTGDINAKSLIIQQGATFVGKSLMPSKAKDLESSTEELPDADFSKKDAVEIAEPETEDKKENEKTTAKTDSNEEKDRDPLGFFRK